MKNRYRPIVRLSRPDQPAHPAYIKSILAEEILMQSSTPGGRSNIHWLQLRPDDRIEDAGMPGREPMRSQYRPPSVILNHETRWEDTENCLSWSYEPTPGEESWRRLQLIKYNARSDELKAKSKLATAEQEELDGLTELINQLATGGEGYLETAYDLLGSGASGITWGLAVANIPVTVKSTFLSRKNRSISFRLKRLEAPKDQARFNYTIEIGRGNRLYALVIGSNGNSSEFVHYKNLSPAERTALIAQREALLDDGRLTVSDLGNIALWEEQIRQLKWYAKSHGQKQLDAEDAALVTSLKKQVSDLKDSKRGLSVETQQQLKIVEDKLYYAKVKFSLQEQTKDLIGKAFDITLHFLRSGYIVIQSKDGQKVYENKLVTGGEPAGSDPKYSDSLPEGAQIVIKSDGGMWSLVYGHPLYDQVGQITTQPFEIPFSFDDDEIEWIIDGDSSMPGCDITMELVPATMFVPGTSLGGASAYQAVITLLSNSEVLDGMYNGMYTPELYFLELHIKASVVDSETVTWYSEDDYTLRGQSRVLDVMLQDDKSKTKLCTAVIGETYRHPSMVGFDKASLPMMIGGSACDIILHNLETGVHEKVITMGYASKVDRGDHVKLNLSSGIASAYSAVGNHVQISVIGCEGFLDREITAPLIGNNRYVGDYIAALARDAGLHQDLYSSLPEGGAGGCPRMKKMVPGGFPDIKPAQGVKVWEWMQEVVRKHAPRWELWSDSSGLRLTVKSLRVRDIDYSETLPTTSHYCIRRASTEAGGVGLYQDTREYYTTVQVIGAVNPVTGMRYVAKATIPQASDPRFNRSMFYIGEDRVRTLAVDESLRSYNDCLQVARDALDITSLTPNGLAPWYQKIRIDLDPSIKAGDLVKINGIKHVVDEIEYSTLNGGGQEGQQLTLVCRLAEDRRADRA